jgi:hypothetical protein
METVNQTKAFQEINNHLRYGKGSKTVCVSTCLSFLGIDFNSYHYTSSDKTIRSWEGVIRRNGYALRSRFSELCKDGISTTMTSLKKNIKKKSYTKDDLFIVSGYQRNSAHLMILNGLGEVVIDTAPGKKWRIRSVKLVYKK